MQWRAGIGNFYRYAHPLIKMKKSLSFNFDFKMVLKNFFYFLFYEKLLLLHGDIETNLVLIKNINPLLAVTGM